MRDHSSLVKTSRHSSNQSQQYVLLWLFFTTIGSSNLLLVFSRNSTNMVTIELWIGCNSGPWIIPKYIQSDLIKLRNNGLSCNHTCTCWPIIHCSLIPNSIKKIALHDIKRLGFIGSHLTWHLEKFNMEGTRNSTILSFYHSTIQWKGMAYLHGLTAWYLGLCWWETEWKGNNLLCNWNTN